MTHALPHRNSEPGTRPPHPVGVKQGIAQTVTAKDFMTSKLVTVDPEMDAMAAIDLLLKHRISGAPVIDEERRFLGVFSEKSSMQVLVDAATEQIPSPHVRAFMNSDLGRTIDEETPFLSVVQKFRETNYRRLPVLHGDKLVGQISRRDVLRKAVEMMRVAPERERSTLYLSALFGKGESPLA